MANYLQAQHHEAWRTTLYPLPSVPTESEAKWNARVLTVKIRQPSHEFTFGVGMSFIPYPLVLTPVV
jgi:hypothetical protein